MSEAKPYFDGTGPPWLADALKMFLGRLSQLHGRARRRTAGAPRLGLIAWGQQYLPEHFQKPPSPMHRWLAEQLDKLAARRGTKLNVLGPRGAAKSTLVTLAFVLRAAVEGTEPYIWIVSDTKHQAHAHLENVKAELVDNAHLAKGYPEASGRGPVWRAGLAALRNGVTLEAFGTGQRIRGRRRRADRPTLIVCDDLQNDGHIESAEMRRRSWDWFHGTLLRAGTPQTNVINLATALHRDALAVRLHQTPGWTSHVFQAILRWPENLGLWEAWEQIYADVENPRAADLARQFYLAHRSAMEVGAVVLWPEVEDLYTLMCIRAESRIAFEREKQNRPLNPELCEWPEDWFGEEIWFADWPKDLTVRTLALDPSKGTDARRGDYSAFVLLGVARDGRLYVEADLARRPSPQIVADGVAWCQRFRPDAFGIEANQFQELLAAEFQREFQRQGLLGIRPWLLDNRLNKRVRIRRLGPLLAAGQLRFKSYSPSTRLLVEQLRQFPVADHDDGPDALEMAVRLAGDLLAGCDDGLGSRLPIGP